MCYEGLNNWLRLKDGGKGSRVSSVQPSLKDAPLITWNQEEGADGHGKDREAIEDRRDAMSGSLFSSEAVGRALVFLLSQPLLSTIPQQAVQCTDLESYLNQCCCTEYLNHCLSYLSTDTVSDLVG